MQELRIEVNTSSTVANAVSVILRGKDDDGHYVCLYFDDVPQPNWWERILGITWSSKIAKSHDRAQRIIIDTIKSQPELDRILSPYRIRNQR